MSTINKVAVIGSGVMGSGIAAQVANAGLPVVLLDIKIEGKDLAKDAVTRMLKTQPAPFMSNANAKLITTGNLDDDLGLLGDCDWIIEVVLEDLSVKHQTYEKLQKHRKKGSIISSNTSTIPLHKLVEGQSDELAKDFMITHFFNPPRYMRLLELVTGEKTRADAVKTIREICDVQLGKGVVVCHDTPGFIANRLGVYWLTAAMNEAVDAGVSVEIADAVMSKPCGIPKTGVFGLIDLVGVDLMPKLAASLLSTLPEKDVYRDLTTDYGFVNDMIEAGYTGRKGKGGFYRLDKTDGKKEKQSFAIKADSFSEGDYTKSIKPKDLKSVKAGKKGLKSVVTTDDEGGKFAWNVLKKTLAYSASLVGEIADTIVDIDEGMKLGYNWKNGPFAMIDALGGAWFAEQLTAEGIAVPDILTKLGDGSFYRIENGKQQYFGTDGQYHDVQRADGVLLLSDVKLTSEAVLKNKSASVWDIGNGVLCFEKTSKMNTFDEDIFDLLDKTINLAEKDEKYQAIVVYNEASHFSAGANLGLAMFMINIAMYPQVESFVRRGQEVFTKLKFSSVPVVAAPSGMALGGGCEILLASDRIQAHAETYCGLVEVGVGLLPGWGGCKEMIIRNQEREKQVFAANQKKADGASSWFSPDTTPMGATRKAFETIAMASVAKSAANAKEIGYFRDSDDITMNRDRLLFDAKETALELVDGYAAPEKRTDIRLAGPSGKVALELAVKDLQKSGKATPYDGVVSDHVATVLTGGPNADCTVEISEDDLLALEVSEFMKLLHNEGTFARIEHMLSKGKPLRN